MTHCKKRIKQEDWLYMIVMGTIIIVLYLWSIILYDIPVQYKDHTKNPKWIEYQHHLNKK